MQNFDNAKIIIIGKGLTNQHPFIKFVMLYGIPGKHFIGPAMAQCLSACTIILHKTNISKIMHKNF